MVSSDSTDGRGETEQPLGPFNEDASGVGVIEEVAPESNGVGPRRVPLKR